MLSEVGSSPFSSIRVFLIYWSLGLHTIGDQLESSAFVPSHYGWMSVLGDGKLVRAVLERLRRLFVTVLLEKSSACFLCVSGMAEQSDRRCDGYNEGCGRAYPCSSRDS